MIHIATVHWRSHRWIEPQLRYLERYLERPYRIYAFLNEVPGDHTDRFFYASTEQIEDHATKLNLLADMIGFSASDPRELLMFIDGDAFPIRAVKPLVERLKRHRLVAVQRYENNGDVQPHPCFCLTTVGFWNEIDGDWHRGHQWLDLQGKLVTDVGGNLLKSLELADVDWYPLRRVNAHDLHPLFFGVYGDGNGPMIYHHGAGFRAGLSRIDFVQDRMRDAEATLMARFMRRLPKRKSGALARLRARHDPVRRLKLQLQEEIWRSSEGLMKLIERDDEFWRGLVEPQQLQMR